MKLLNGAELAGFVKEQQAKQVRSLRQSFGIAPKLVVLQTMHNPAIDTYVRLKKAYGEDILIDVQLLPVEQASLEHEIQKANEDKFVHGVILQLPLSDPTQTERLCALISPDKDVDALGPKPIYDAATPTAILWLLAGYNINLLGKDVLIIGQGKLVGAPLRRLLQSSGIEPKVADRRASDLRSLCLQAEIIITATGQPGLLTSDMLGPGVVVIDAGTSSEDGVLKGDVAPEVYELSELTITPQKGGVGPLTIAALFSNVIKAARGTA